MNFLQNIGNAISHVNLSPSLLFTALAASYSKSLSVRYGSKRVTVADTGGPPQHLTFAQAIAAFEAVEQGKTGLVTIGDVQVVIDDWEP